MWVLPQQSIAFGRAMPFFVLRALFCCGNSIHAQVICMSTITHKGAKRLLCMRYSSITVHCTVGDTARAYPPGSLFVQVLGQLAGDALGQAVLHQGRLWKRSES